MSPLEVPVAPVGGGAHLERPMSIDQLKAAPLSDRYRVEREIGSGGI
jgi:hypothetical protein